MQQTILQQAAPLYGVDSSQLHPLSGGHFSGVYQFERQDEAYILRITPPNPELDLAAMRVVLTWLDYLAQHGASVSRPIPSQHNRLIETLPADDGAYVLVAFTKAGGRLAESMAPDRWPAERYEQLGRTVGRLHGLAQVYQPATPALARPNWDEIGNCFNPGIPPGGIEPIILAKRAAVLSQIQDLPQDKAGFGLIHADLHFANIMVAEAEDTITIIDFDDCCYGWFVMDIAMSLFDLLVLSTSADHKQVAERFLTNYLRGYRQENQLDDFWLRQLPYFLKLLEIGIFMMVRPEYDPHDMESWVGRFMAGREARIMNDVPVLS